MTLTCGNMYSIIGEHKKSYSNIMVTYGNIMVT